MPLVIDINLAGRPREVLIPLTFNHEARHCIIVDLHLSLELNIILQKHPFILDLKNREIFHNSRICTATEQTLHVYGVTHAITLDAVIGLLEIISKSIHGEEQEALRIEHVTCFNNYESPSMDSTSIAHPEKEI
ncbi:hypothetical protein VE01_10815 [Pseudogymnoascus verrucosus]|uniref:Uncharacterized protein n=1 Tax=Pseudogymnoascus verrucosus TaxID=342668 RepID=A0A2P6FH04_9PEZI|nr:uncharacterized protein VE01_10815 [Pseudogymnoascus verrucosus]PQM43919.1 hypothetical protein VE01_10815 [Pseudogymnoascus verrucosus]